LLDIRVRAFVVLALFFGLPPQRTLAALLAAMLRALADMVNIRRFPPILPPLLPIAAMKLEICSVVAGASSPWVERFPRKCASWFTSVGRFLLIRFGIRALSLTLVVFGSTKFDPRIQSSPLPDFEEWIPGSREV
jgi:hypothetical protein